MTDTPEEKQLLKELDDIRKSGSLTNMQRVINLLKEYRFSVVGKNAQSLLADVKDKGIIPILIESIRLEDNHMIRKELIQACWESGLDYSAHLDYMTGLFLSLGYIEALEAFTLIENTCLDFKQDYDVMKSLVYKIKSLLPDLDEDKKILAVELIHVLED